MKIKYLLLLPAVYICLMLLITISGLFAYTKPCNYAIVLGNKVEIDGKPSKRLQARLDNVVKLFENGKCKFIIVSAGTGQEGYDEAKVMKSYLVSKNIQDTLIVMDPNGINTHFTAFNSRELLSHEKNVIVVSQYFHLTRSKLSFKNAGFNKVYTSYPIYFEFRDIYSIFREVPAYFKYLIKRL